jgi:hypothetical protein
MRVGHASWSVEASEAWTVTEHPECLTLEFSDDGSLQFSSAHKQDGLVTEQDLLSFVEGQAAWGQHRSITLGQFSGIVFEYVESSSVWARWFLKNASTLVFVTYNGTQEAFERESGEVGEVLASLRARGLGGA